MCVSEKEENRQTDEREKGNYRNMAMLERDREKKRVRKCVCEREKERDS